MISFDQRDAGRAADSGNNRGVVAGREVGQQGRFCIASWSKAGRLDSILLRVFPIIVSPDFRSVRIK